MITQWATVLQHRAGNVIRLPRPPHSRMTEE